MAINFEDQFNSDIKANGITFGKNVTVTPADGLTVGGFIVPQKVHESYNGIGATQAVSTNAFVADTGYVLTAVTCVWATASTSGTFMVEKLTGTTAPGSGTALLTGTVDTSTTANTVTNPALIATVASLTLAAGDRIGFKWAGTVTSLAGFAVTLTFKRV